MKRLAIALAASLLATAVAAQTSGQTTSPSTGQTPSPSATQPLNLKLPPQNDLPPSDLPAHAGTAAKPASSAPGVYYGDTSGSTSHADERRARAQACDDSTYNQAQTHGSVGMGVMAGSHMSGNYQTGTVGVSKNLGSCDDPKGSVSFSIGVGQGHFNGRRW